MALDIWDALWSVLYSRNYRLVIYVYRLNAEGKPQRPYLLKTAPDPVLLDLLQRQHGGGEFRILVRAGRRMILSGEIAVEPINSSRVRV